MVSTVARSLGVLAVLGCPGADEGSGSGGDTDGTGTGHPFD